METKNFIEIFINGESFQAEQGETIMQVCGRVGYEIPRFCYHERLPIAGNCRMCLVEVEGAPKLLASCAVEVTSGMKILLESEKAKKGRERVLELLLGNHPLDCPTCDQAGECDLQDQVTYFGMDYGRFQEVKDCQKNKDAGRLIQTVMSRCISCTRCIRYTNEIGEGEFTTLGRGHKMAVGSYIEDIVSSKYSGNLIDLCPVGALTSKPYIFQHRPWEINETETSLTSQPKEVKLQHQSGEVTRVLPKFQKNEWFSDAARYSYDASQVDKIIQPYLNSLRPILSPTHPDKVKEDKDLSRGLNEALLPLDLVHFLEQFCNLLDSKTQITACIGAKAQPESIVLAKDFLDNRTSENITEIYSEFTTIPSSIAFEVCEQDEDIAYIFIGNSSYDKDIYDFDLRLRYLPIFKGYIGPYQQHSTFTQLGQNLLAFHQLLQGKSIWSHELVGKKVYVIVGEREEQLNIIARMVQETLADTQLDIEIKMPNVTIGQLATRKIGLGSIEQYSNTFPLTKTNEYQVLYLIETENIPVDRSVYDYVVYQGNRMNENAAQADLIIPAIENLDLILARDVESQKEIISAFYYLQNKTGAPLTLLKERMEVIYQEDAMIPLNYPDDLVTYSLNHIPRSYSPVFSESRILTQADRYRRQPRKNIHKYDL